MKNFIEELEDVVDKHMINTPKASGDVFEIVTNCIKHFDHPGKAVFSCLIALGNCVKHTAEICKRHEDDDSFSEILSDPVIKMVLPFVNQIMSCKRFK